MKNILIFGDSYSTYEGYIPEGYPTYYSPQGCIKGPSVQKMQVEETWWKRVVNLTDYNLLLNNSWSGSTIGYTGYTGDCSKTSSFIYRFRKLKEEVFFEKNVVDMVFVFGGTNDSWSNAPLGEMKFSNWEEKDLFQVLPAVSHFVCTLKSELPNAEIIVIINTEIKKEIQDALKKASEYYGIQYIALKDIDKDCGHPTVKGMLQISEQVFSVLAK